MLASVPEARDLERTGLPFLATWCSGRSENCVSEECTWSHAEGDRLTIVSAGAHAMALYTLLAGELLSVSNDGHLCALATSAIAGSLVMMYVMYTSIVEIRLAFPK